MDETNPYINAVYEAPSLYTTGYTFTDKTRDDTYDPEVEKQAALNFRLRINNQNYYFVPRSVLEKGTKVKDEIVVYPGVLASDFEQKFAPYSQPYTAKQVYDTLYNYSTAVDPKENQFLKDIKEYGYKEDEVGYLVPGSFFYDFKTNVIPSTATGTKYGTVNVNNIAGIGTKDGQKVFVIDTAGSTGPNPQGYYGYNPETGNLGQGAVSTYKEPASWAKAANIVGYGLIGLGTLGMAGYGPLAGGGATAGATTGATAGTAASGAGIVGTPGVSTIFPVAAPVAPTVTAIAPTTLAAGGLAAGAATNASLYPAVQVAPSFTPAPGSLQAALPGLGVETAASAAPFTAIPGSFQAALPVLGIASAPSLAGNLAAASSGPSITDALRVANQAQGLLGAGQPVIPQAPQQQGLPGRAAGTVDYSGILALLQRQATTPGVSSLLAPAQLRQMYQPLLTPSTLSLLG